MSDTTTLPIHTTRTLFEQAIGLTRFYGGQSEAPNETVAINGMRPVSTTRFIVATERKKDDPVEKAERTFFVAMTIETTRFNMDEFTSRPIMLKESTVHDLCIVIKGAYSLARIESRDPIALWSEADFTNDRAVKNFWGEDCGHIRGRNR